MKKVIALMLAVLMLATLAFAAADIVPSSTIRIGREVNTLGLRGHIERGTVNVQYRVEKEKEKGDDGVWFDLGGGDTAPMNGDEFLLRSVNSDNYSLASVKYNKGKNLVSKIWIDDSEDCVKIAMKDDLTNTSVKDFDLTFRLKGKGKYTIRTDSEWELYDNSVETKTFNDTGKGAKVSIPDVQFKVIGTVGYGKVEIGVAGDDRDEIDQLQSITLTSRYGTVSGEAYDDTQLAHKDKVDINRDVVKFVNNADARRVAGAYTADAILTQDYDDGELILEARVYANETLYFGIDTVPDGDLVDRISDMTGDVDFFYFNEDTRFTKLLSTATLYFENADEDCYVYEVKNNKLYPFGEYSDDEDCWVGKTRTLGQYVVAHEELSMLEGTASENPDNQNPDTGANDVVGVATALAAVALVSAAAISLKK